MGDRRRPAGPARRRGAARPGAQGQGGDPCRRADRGVVAVQRVHGGGARPAAGGGGRRPPYRRTAARGTAARLRRGAAGGRRGDPLRAGVPVDAARGHRPRRPAHRRRRLAWPGRRHLHQRARRRLPAVPGRTARPAAGVARRPPPRRAVRLRRPRHRPAAAGPRHRHRPARTVPARPVGAAALQGTSRSREGVAHRRAPGGDPWARRARRRRAAARAARRHGAAAGALPPARLGGRPRRPAPHPARCRA